MAPERGSVDPGEVERMANEAWQRIRREDRLAAMIVDGIDLARRIHSGLKGVIRPDGGGKKDT